MRTVGPGPDGCDDELVAFGAPPQLALAASTKTINP